MKRTLQTQHFELAYSDDHVQSNVLWENHCHALYEAIAVIKGDISIMLEGRSYRLTAGQCIIIPPLCYHTVTANTKGEYKRMTAFFDISAVPAAVREDFMRCDAALAIFALTNAEELRGIFQSGRHDYYAPLAESIMVQLFYSRLKAPAAKDADEEVSLFILQMIAYVEEHLCERILLDDLAKHTARSKSFVCHQFEEKMGIPPMQYILQKRMAYAQKQIREGRSSTAVAAELGYKSYATFYRMYQKHCGVSPSGSKPKK